MLKKTQDVKDTAQTHFLCSVVLNVWPLNDSVLLVSVATSRDGSQCQPLTGSFLRWPESIFSTPPSAAGHVFWSGLYMCHIYKTLSTECFYKTLEWPMTPLEKPTKTRLKSADQARNHAEAVLVTPMKYFLYFCCTLYVRQYSCESFRCIQMALIQNCVTDLKPYTLNKVERRKFLCRRFFWPTWETFNTEKFTGSSTD